MSKAIERRMTLKDQVTPTMSKINKSTLKYKKNVKNLRKEGERTWSGMKSGMIGVAAAGVALLGSVMAINSVEEAYKNQIEAETKLEAVMESTGKATKQQVEGLKRYAVALQNIGVVGDEVNLAGMQQLATFNVTASTVKTLSSGMADLVAQQKGVNASQDDMKNIANMVGKAMEGQIGALSRVGISFSDAQGEVLKYGNEQEKAAVLAEVLRQNVGGVNEALAETSVGQVTQATNAMSDLQETVGSTVMNIKGQLAAAFMENLPQIQAAIENITSGINQWTDSGGIDRFVSNIQTAIGVVDKLQPIIMGVATAFVAYKLYALAATVQQWALNVAMNANPIGIIITLIGALVGVVIWLIDNYELAKLKGMQMWNVMLDGADAAYSFLASIGNKIFSVFSFVTESIKYAFSKLWDKVISDAEKGVGLFAQPINAVLSALGQKEINVDFSAAKMAMDKPIYTDLEHFNSDIGLDRFKFTDDALLAQVEKAKAEQKKNQDEKAEENMQALVESIDNNTDATVKNTSAVNKSKSSDMTAESIADTLLPRLEREVYG